MNLLSLLLIAIPVLTLIVVTVQLIRTMAANVQTGKQVRQDLAEQIAELQFGDMLALEGVDQQAFLHHIPLADVKQDLARCRSCSMTTLCNEVLNVVPRDSRAAKELEFCPNMGAILQYKLSI